MSFYNLKTALPFVFALVMIIGIQMGIQYSDFRFGKMPLSKKGNSTTLDQLMNKVSSKYVDSVDYKELMTTAIKSILNQLDPHSIYIPAKELKGLNEGLEGRFEGIGVEFYMVEDTIMIVSVIPGGPSEKLGLRAGDKIVKIEGDTVALVEITVRDVASKLKGPRGTSVNVDILRNGELMNLDITRGRVTIRSVEASYMANESVGYIKLNKFAETTHAEFIDAVEQLKSEGMLALIIDVRGNPGGYLPQATRLVNELLSGEKLMLYTEGRASPRREYLSNDDGSFLEGDLRILIDEHSASASEILAGAIQDWDRGVIVGRRSFGKGLVQEQYLLEDSSAVRLTIAKYYTPAGRSIQKPYGKDIEYQNELMERVESGGLSKPDSTHLSDKFKAPSGKTVYGGGGIMPDIFVPFDTTWSSDYYRLIYHHDLIAQFAYGYFCRHMDELDVYTDLKSFQKGFTISSKLMGAFVAYAKRKGVTAESGELEISGKLIKNRLKAFIAKALLDNDGFFSILNKQDKTFLKALESL